MPKHIIIYPTLSCRQFSWCSKILGYIFVNCSIVVTPHLPNDETNHGINEIDAQRPVKMNSIVKHVTVFTHDRLNPPVTMFQI